MTNTSKVAATLFVGLMIAFSFAPHAFGKKAKHAVSGEAVFRENCASCHAGGGNTVNPKKPVAGSDKLANRLLFKSYLENPVGHMPYYKHVVTDQKAVRALYDYCKTLKRGEGA
jgi:mono/diheme cytochrome c family protein